MQRMLPICNDIWTNWQACRQAALMTGMLFWTVGMIFSRLRGKGRMAPVLWFLDGLYLCYFFHVTLTSRTMGSRREVALMPFASLDPSDREFPYVIENFLLFFPFGILSYLTSVSCRRKWGIKGIFLASLSASASVEVLQYVFACGKTETDDVIVNVLGAVAGYTLIKGMAYVNMIMGKRVRE